MLTMLLLFGRFFLSRYGGEKSEKKKVKSA